MKQMKLIILIVVLFAVTGIGFWLDSDDEPTDNKAAVTNSQENKTDKPAGDKTGDNNPEQNKPAENKTPEGKPANGQAIENKPADSAAKPADNAPTQTPAATDSKPADSNAKPADAKPEEAKPTDSNAKPADTKPTEQAKEPDKPEVPMENVNIKDMEFRNLITQIAEWEGKPIIPHNDVLQLRLTIYSPEKLPRPQALELIYAAIKAKGFVAEYTDNAIYFKPISEAKFGKVPTVSPDEQLTEIASRSMIVQKFFKTTNLKASEIERAIKPVIPEHGAVTSDDKTGIVGVIDTVENLIRIERIITQIDLPSEDDIITKPIPITVGDPSEIAQILRIMLSEGQIGNRGRYDSSSGTINIAGGKTVTLIPEPNRKWIITKAPADIMTKIEEWVTKLDNKSNSSNEQSLKKVVYVSPREVSDQLSRMLERMPGQEIRSAVLVQPLEQARQILVVGNQENRDMIMKLIDEIDIPPQKYETQVFKLKYADPDNIKEFIDGLYGDGSSSSGGRYSYSYTYYYSDSVSTKDEVKVISYPTLKQVTVIASKEKLAKISEQITEWDKPIDTADVEPRIYELKNSDPKMMATLLSKLFTDSSSEAESFYSYYYGDSYGTQEKIVGPLYGQLVFEPIEESKKIIVISKIPEAYEVVEKLIQKIDSKKPAELPMVVTLQYADCEDLCEQLNAIFNVEGTSASVRRRDRGLSEYKTGDSEGSSTGITSNNQNGNQNGNNNNNGNNITGPWSAGRTNEEVMPISNLIGKVRFMPVFRSKAILVLAPEEYHTSIHDIITSLDKPVKQVMLEVVIIEVNHDQLVNLGMRFASNSAALGSGGVNSISASAGGDFLRQTGASYTNSDGKPQQAWSFTTGFNLAAMLDLLITETSGKILNQPTIWTKDNEEAAFFNGQEVPFISNAVGSSEGTSTRNNYDYKSVGVNLQVRPSITPENKVDTTINLTISQLDSQLINGNISTNKFNTYTHTIVEDGQTIMLSGITLQKVTNVKSKVPLLGDIPLLGALFSHNKDITVNNQLLAFVTPHVFDSDQTKQESQDKLKGSVEKMEDTIQELQDIMDETLNKNENKKQEKSNNQEQLKTEAVTEKK